MKFGLSLSGLLQHSGDGDMVQRFADVLDLVREARALGFDYIKPDAPIKPRDPDGGAKKPRAKRAKKPRGGETRRVYASRAPLGLTLLTRGGFAAAHHTVGDGDPQDQCAACHREHPTDRR